jgi:hypothetical protein
MIIISIKWRHPVEDTRQKIIYSPRGKQIFCSDLFTISGILLGTIFFILPYSFLGNGAWYRLPSPSPQLIRQVLYKFFSFDGGESESGKLLSSLLETKIFHNSVLVEEDDEAILFLLDPCVLKNNEVGEIRLFESKCRGVLTKIGIDKDVSIVLLLNSLRRSEDRKNFTLGGRAYFDFFVGIVLNLRAHIDPPDAAATCQNHHQKGY